MPRTLDLNEDSFTYYPQLGRVRQFVRRHYSEQLKLADVARIARMERTAFSTFFHRKVGVCYRDWLAGVRVDKAMEIMASRDLPIARVAQRVGYMNIRTFQRVFLRTTGSTPSDYRRRVRPSMKRCETGSDETSPPA